MTQINHHRKYAGIPGVYYPPQQPRIYQRAPGYVSTREAASLLGCNIAAARSYLHRRRVPCRRVFRHDGPPALYWRLARVKQLIPCHAVIETPPPGLITSAEAAERLGLSRSALYRYSRKGMLRVATVRIATPRGPKERCYYSPEEIDAVRNHISDVLRQRLDGSGATAPNSASEASDSQSTAPPSSAS